MKKLLKLTMLLFTVTVFFYGDALSQESKKEITEENKTYKIELTKEESKKVDKKVKNIQKEYDLTTQQATQLKPLLEKYSKLRRDYRKLTEEDKEQKGAIISEMELLLLEINSVYTVEQKELIKNKHKSREVLAKSKIEKN